MECGVGTPGCHKVIAFEEVVISAAVLSISGRTLKKVMLTLLFAEEHITCLAVSELFPLMTKRDLRNLFVLEFQLILYFRWWMLNLKWSTLVYTLLSERALEVLCNSLLRRSRACGQKPLLIQTGGGWKEAAPDEVVWEKAENTHPTKSKAIWFNTDIKLWCRDREFYYTYLIEEVNDAAVRFPAFRKQTPQNQVINYTLE